MTLREIKKAISDGKNVKWSNNLYNVIKANNDYLIVCSRNNNCIGLTWRDGTTLNGKESDFYISI